MKKFEKRQPVLLRLLLVLAASLLFAFNINSFVHAAFLFPGGFAGVALLIQKTCRNFWGISLPYSILTYALNAVPIMIGFRFIGRKFTVLSCVLIIISGLATDFLHSVVSSSESGHLEKAIRQTDPDAFINVLQSKAIIGKFFKRSND